MDVSLQKVFIKRPWNKIPLLYLSESLCEIPPELYCIKPHCYQKLGAPYGGKISPWLLRREVIRRLLLAQKFLRELDENLSLAIFDAWRPIEVQKFMYEYAISQELLSRGVTKKNCRDDKVLEDVTKSVEKFWAAPTFDKSMPPPHSTGGAVDLTLSSVDGSLLEMGGEIDCIGPVSDPNYFQKAAELNLDTSACLWHSRRRLLEEVMKRAGFVQHPHEWWHFSYGDQLWAWLTNNKYANYGALNDSESKSKI